MTGQSSQQRSRPGGATSGVASVAELVLRHGRDQPEATALIEAGPGGQRVSYGALGNRAAAFRDGLVSLGLRAGDRVVVLVRPSADLYALLVGLLSAGLVAVVVDGALGRGRLGHALAAARPAAVVGPGWLRIWRLVLPALRPIRWIPLEDPALAPAPGEARPPMVFPTAHPRADDPAVISFTSGSTGRPKGAVRTHRLLMAQHLALREVIRDRPDEVGLTLFPLVGLHHLCCGHAVVLPGARRRSSRRQAEALARLMVRHRVTALSAAPAALEALAARLEGRRERLLDLRHVIGGGGPVRPELCRRLVGVFPEADGRVVYGSTEAEPIASASMAEVAAARGSGHLVGAPVAAAEVEVVRLPAPAPALGPTGLRAYRVARGDYGEVVVRGEHVVRGYFENPAMDAVNKVSAPGGVWHRTGDVARVDEQGRLWLAGRIGDLVRHRGRTVYPLELEADIHALPGVRGAALVVHGGAPEGELAVEAGRASAAVVLGRVEARLRELDLATLPIRRVRRIPVDPRHGSKIDRPALRARLERGRRHG